MFQRPPPLEPNQAYVTVTRLTYEKGGETHGFYKVEGLARRSARWLHDEDGVPPFEGRYAHFLVQRVPPGGLKFIRQVDWPRG